MPIMSYFVRTKLDEEFFNKYIEDRLPKKIIDMHLHITNEEVSKNIQPDPNDWANQCCEIMTAEDYAHYAKAFYPGREVFCNALPSVTRGVNEKLGNDYLRDLKKDGKVLFNCMMIVPWWDGEYTEKVLLEGNFDGFKPYPDIVAGGKGMDIGMFSFVNREQYEVLNKHKRAMVLHLPRAGRFPDDANVRELFEIKEKYPDIKLIIAHCGRSYAINTIKQAKEKYGSLFKEFQYDLAAVLNPKVLDFMLENVPHDHIMYGTDLPIFLWHGRRRWTDDKYFNLCREEFPWVTHEEGKETEENYTFFLYEQLKNILDVCDHFDGKATAEKIFYSNAINYLSAK